MDKEDARSLDPEAQQDLRKRAIQLRRLGHTYKAISTVIRVSPNTIWKWCRSYELQGDAGIVSKRRGRRPGAGRSLSAAQEAEVIHAIRQGTPDQHDLRYALWSRRAVQAFILHRFKQDMPLRTVGAYVRRWGFGTPTMLRLSQEPAPLRLQQLLGADYPHVVQRAKATLAQIHWCELVDGDTQGVPDSESPSRSQAGSHAAPASTVPWPIIATISTRGKFRWMVTEGGADAQAFAGFLRQLVKETKKRILLMMDGQVLEGLEPAQRWLASSMGQVELLTIPRVSPYRETYPAVHRPPVGEIMSPD